MTPYIQLWGRSSMKGTHLQCFQCLGVNRGKVWNLGVPLQQRPRLVAEALDRVGVERPYFVDDRTDVRVDDVRSIVRVSGEVVLHHGAARDRVDVVLRIEAVIERADVDIV